MTLMRGTVHVVSRRRRAVLRPITEPAHRATSPARTRDDLAGIDLDELAARVRELVEERPRTPAELVADARRALAGRASRRR